MTAIKTWAVALPLFALVSATALAQNDETCAQRVVVLEAVVAAEPAWPDRIVELLAMIRESDRRGEETLCRDLAEDLRDWLRAYEA